MFNIATWYVDFKWLLCTFEHYFLIQVIHVFSRVIKSSHFGITGNSLHDWIVYGSLGCFYSLLWDINLIIWNTRFSSCFQIHFSGKWTTFHRKKIQRVSQLDCFNLPAQAAISSITLTASRSREIPFICWVVMCMIMTMNSILDNLEKMKESYNFSWSVKRLCNNQIMAAKTS